MRQLLLAILLSTAFTTQASMLNSCKLTAEVLEDTPSTKPTSKIQNKDLPLSIKVLKAEPNGRADLGCQQFAGQNLSITLKKAPTSSLKKGKQVKIQYLHMNDRAIPNKISYTWLE